MDVIATTGEARVWLGFSERPSEFSSPAPGEFALLLVVATDEISVDEQAALSEQFVRSGCRYAVCFGPTSSSWDDSIDMVGVMDEVDGRPSPFVMTSWHDDEPIEETAEFFARHTSFDDWSPSQFVVFVLGGSVQLQADVREAVIHQFS